MTFGILGIISAISTLMIPAAARLGLMCFLAIRVLNGITFAANFSVVGSFTNKWTYYKQVELFLRNVKNPFRKIKIGILL